MWLGEQIAKLVFDSQLQGPVLSALLFLAQWLDALHFCAAISRLDRSSLE